MATDSPPPGRPSSGGTRSITFAGLLLGLGALCSCFGSDGISQLFGDDTTGGGGGAGAQGGFDPGLGGGVILRDLFQGARIEQAAPSVTSTYPEGGANLVNVKSVLSIEFSESIDAQTALSGIRVFSAGSAVPVPGQIQLFQGQTVALFTPNSDLVPGTSYEIAVSNSLTDLQGKQIDTGGAADLRFRFTTQNQTDDPGFEVGLSSPGQSEGNVPRDAEAVIFFSEPVNSTTGPAGLMAPGNITVKVNGALLLVGVDYTQTAVGAATLMGVQIQLNNMVPAAADVDIQVSDRVETADGEHTLAGGNGFRLRWTAQNAQTPNDIQFPNTFALPGADGFVARPNLNAFLADVVMTTDGQGADDVTILFFDASQNNALVYEDRGGNPQRFNVDLQPDPNTPAFNDGDILVGAFIRRGTFRSTVSVLRVLRKDTVGPLLQFLGPPAVQVGTPPFAVNTFYTYVNDPILYGRMDEPCQGIQVEFNQTGSADFSSIQFAPGLSTLTDEFFFTGPTRDGPLDPQLERYASFAVIATDHFGNGNVDVRPTFVATVGVAGARWANPDGNSALVVAVTDVDDFLTLGAASSGTWGMVVVEPFPPDPTGAGQTVRGLQASGGLVRFLDSELPATPQITVTVVANDDDNQDPTFWNVVTYAGLDKPSSGSPLVLLPLLDKASPDATVPVQVNVTGGNAGTINTVGSSDADLDPSTAQGQRMVVLANTGDTIPTGENRPQVITGTETATGGDQRYTSTAPFAEGDAPAVGGGGGGGQITPEQTLDFTGRVTFNSATPDVAFNLTFDNVADLAGTGLIGAEADQYRRARLLVRAPGLVVPPAVSITLGSLFARSGTGRTATLLKPANFQVNDSLTNTGHEDSALELFLQPDLVDPNQPVDVALQNLLIRSELHIEDTVDGGANPHSAFVRQRFFTDVTTQAASFQTVPTVTASVTTHPPVIDWPEVTGGSNAVHRLHLYDSASGRTWRIYVPAGTLGNPIMFQVPLITGGFVDTSAAGSRAVPFQFANPGTYNVYVESYDFDPAAGTATYQFDFNQFFQSDLEREHFHLSRSDTNFSVTTTP